MNKETVIFKIFTCANEANEANGANEEPVENREYECNLDDTIISIKNRILSDIFNNEYNSLVMENITERVYKDYGKLFFDKGLILSTVDNYKLSQFTNPGRVFSFIVSGKNISNVSEVSLKKDNTLKTSKTYKNYEDKYKNKSKTNKNEFVFDENDFPSL